jgi:hypothetical protein
MKRASLSGVLLLLALMVVAVRTDAQSSRSPQLGISGRDNAYASAAAEGQFVAIAWGATVPKGATDIYLATSRDGGATFGTPARVNDAGSQASLAGEQPPRVTLVPRAGREPSIVVVWTSRATTGTRLVAARSENGGRSFDRPSTVPGADAAGNRGWHSTAADRQGHVVAIWLDHRETARGAAAGGEHHAGHDPAAHATQKTDGVARAQLSKLFVGGLDRSHGARALTGGVCYCCKTAIAVGADGSFYAAWRHVYPGNIRDIAFTMSRDHGATFTPPARVSEDRWVLDGCPENGPALAIDGRNQVHIVWPTLVPGATPGSEPTLALFYARSADGRRFTARQRIPTEGFPRHPQIAIDPRGRVVVAWDEQIGGGGRRVALARGTIDAAGSPRFARQVISEGTAATYPAVAATSDATVAVWTVGPAGRAVLRIQRVQN